jgi:hypothetical protein
MDHGTSSEWRFQRDAGATRKLRWFTNWPTGGMPGERRVMCSGISGKSLNGPILALVNKPGEWCGVYHRNQVPLEIELLGESGA